LMIVFYLKATSRVFWVLGIGSDQALPLTHITIISILSFRKRRFSKRQVTGSLIPRCCDRCRGQPCHELSRCFVLLCIMPLCSPQARTANKRVTWLRGHFRIIR